MLELERLEKGKTHRGFLSPDIGHAVDIPYIIVKGSRPGPTLLVTAGIHGAEYASIEAANRTALTNPENISGTLVVLPVVNTVSFFARSIYITPVDQKNLNRMFPCDPQGSFTQRLAYWLIVISMRTREVSHIVLVVPRCIGIQPARQPKDWFHKVVDTHNPSHHNTISNWPVNNIKELMFNMKCYA